MKNNNFWVNTIINLFYYGGFGGMYINLVRSEAYYDDLWKKVLIDKNILRGDDIITRSFYCLYVSSCVVFVLGVFVGIANEIL